MNAQRLKKYVNEWGRHRDSPKDLQALADRNETLTPEEKAEILGVIRDLKPDEGPAKAKTMEEAKAISKKSDFPIDLDKYDYFAPKGFVGELFTEYLQAQTGVYDERLKEWAVKPLFEPNATYDYEVFDVQPIFVEKYPGMKDTPTVLYGIRINQQKPLQTTRIQVRRANILNEQIGNAQARTGGGRTGYARYYLLKKS